jgi:hypothetical protein
MKQEQVFVRDFSPEKWYAYFAYQNGDDGWYIGSFVSEEDAESYEYEEENAIRVRIFQGYDPELA